MHYTAMAGLTLFPHVTAVVAAPALSSDLLAIVVAIVAFLVSAVFFLYLVPDHAPPIHAHADGLPTANPGPIAVGHPEPGYLPVEREGATQFIAVDRVVAVHANAHYTYIFDGTAKLFCPLAIGDVEARLAPGRFARVHRSHIVKLDSIIRLKRAGDSGQVELAGAERYAVPVARSRVSWLKSRLGLPAGAHHAGAN
jgi:hypothetical protein